MAQLEKFKVSSSPHIADDASVDRIMMDVVIALMPATVAGAIFFGFYALLLVLVSIAACVLFEYLYDLLAKKMNSIWDLSAVVTGLLLGLNLPPRVPLYIPIIGAAFAIIIVKMLFGGIGKNFANPAIAARIFLTLAFMRSMTMYIAPMDYSGGFFPAFFDIYDATATATPLRGGGADLLSLFLGNIGGCIGETSALALLLGGAYLLARRVISFEIPLIIIATVAAFTLIFKGNISAVLPALLSGGLLLGSIFMATDYSTTPNTARGAIIYALIVGAFTAIIRQYSDYPEGMSFAILLGNLCVPLIDKYIYPKNFGYSKERADGNRS
ncbi:MAG: RnfABCDGE type electron transport complex subunit D [Clostridiales bacterium]|jgi:electron transport complex protein RnfD|nr:RnfABCDGE type electron transport complex subunit D [Clostridiales bacterium]